MRFPVCVSMRDWKRGAILCAGAEVPPLIAPLGACVLES